MAGELLADFFMWKQPVGAAGAVAAVVATTILVTVYNFTVLSLLCAVGQVILVVTGVASFSGVEIRRQPRDSWDLAMHRLAEDATTLCLPLVHVLTKAVTGEDRKLTLAVFGVVTAVQLLCSFLGGWTLLLISTAVAFTSPLWTHRVPFQKWCAACSAAGPHDTPPSDGKSVKSS
eukprot:Sspe_Gene.61811::Locus_34416_Transcript_1_1_Confidence_1.000_Length_942::g.61811::m.61811